MVKSRGYTGSVVRRWVRLIRPAATPTIYRRVTTLAAKETQVDWGAFGSNSDRPRRASALRLRDGAVVLARARYRV
jgi:hypothetical protein